MQPIMPIKADIRREFRFDNVVNDDWALAVYRVAARDWQDDYKPKTRMVDGSSPVLDISANSNPTWTQVAVDMPVTDFTNVHGMISYKLDEADTPLPSGSNAVSLVQIVLHSNSGDGVFSLSSNSVQTRKGWIHCTFTSEQYKTIPNVTLTDVNRMYIRINYNNGWSHKFRLGYFAIWDKPAKAKVLLRIDDGRTENPYDQNIKARIGSDMNMPIHYAVIGKLTGYPNYITLKELHKIQEMGHILCNHLWLITGTNNTGTRSGWRWKDAGSEIFTKQKVREQNINQMADWMERNGLGKFSRLIIVPGGWDHPKDDELLNDGTVRALWYTEGSGAPTGTSIGSNFEGWPHTDHKRFYANRLTDNMTLAQVKTSIDNLVVAKGFETIYCHSTTNSDWQKILEHLQGKVEAGTLEILNMNDFFPGGLSTLPRSEPAHLAPIARKDT